MTARVVPAPLGIGTAVGILFSSACRTWSRRRRFDRPAPHAAGAGGSGPSFGRFAQDSIALLRDHFEAGVPEREGEVA